MKRHRGLAEAVRMVAVAAAAGGQTLVPAKAEATDVKALELAAGDVTGVDAAQDAVAAGTGIDAVAACEARGAAILAGNPVPSAWQSQHSLYNRLTSRCYIEMRVETPAAGSGRDRTGRFLYDGNTGELLAFAEIRDGQKSGRVFDLTHATATFANDGWDDAISYIRQKMTPP